MLQKLTAGAGLHSIAHERGGIIVWRCNRLHERCHKPSTSGKMVQQETNTQTLQNKIPSAVLSSLVGRPKLRGSHYPGNSTVVVPLILPREHRLPFAVTFEIVRPCPTAAPIKIFDPAEDCQIVTELDEECLDLYYVLSGEGNLVCSDNSSTLVRAGDSILAWSNTTRLTTSVSAEHNQKTIDRSVGDEFGKAGCVAALKFHIPFNLLHQAGYSEALLVQREQSENFHCTKAETDGSCSPSTSGCDCGDGSFLTEAEVHQIMFSVRARSEKAVNTLFAVMEEQMTGRDNEFHTNSALPERGFNLNWMQELLQLTTPLDAPDSQVFNGSRTSSPSPSLSPTSSPSSPSPLLYPSSCVLLKRAMEEFIAYRFPGQTNKLAFVFRPSELDLPLSFGVEVFEAGHQTPLHLHKAAHELFFVLAGYGDAYCDGHHTSVQAGDMIIFPPGSKHGLDNNSSDKLYCLQLMAPNEMFVEFVMSGTLVGRLDDEDICNLTNNYC